MFKNFSIKAKIISIVGIAILLSSLCVAFISIYSIQSAADDRIEKYKQSAYKNAKRDLKKFSDISMSIVRWYEKQSSKENIKIASKEHIDKQSNYLFNILKAEYKQYKLTMPEESLKSLLMSIVENARYGKSGYFWINDFNYKMIMHPIKKELTGKLFLNTPKVPFVQLGVDELKNSGEDIGYIQYSFYSPSAKKYMHKASIVRVFKPFNWIIGTGAYIDDISKEMKQKALKAIKQMRYGKNGYFWINDMTNRMLMHPIKPKLDGKIFIDSPKVPFVELGVRKLRSSKKDIDFIEYKFYTPSTKKYSHKLSLVSHFKPWDWVIGTGIYTDHIEEEIVSMKANLKEQVNSIVKKIIWATLATFAILFLLASYFSDKIIAKPIQKFKIALKSFFGYLANPNKKIRYIDIDTTDEFGQMGKSVNESIKKSFKAYSEMANLTRTMDKIVIVSETDEKGIITYVSDAFCKVSGYSCEELIGQPHFIMRHPDTSREFFKELWTTIQEGKTWEGDIINIRKDGTVYWLSTIISPKFDKEEKIYGYTSIRQDITEKKEIAKLNKNLLNMVEKLNND
jgi:methyl-accepting chemotaxis protein